jgi:DNA replication protein DnaC
MKEKIHKTLAKMQNDTPTANSQNTSNEIEPVKPLGDPNCPHCGGAGYIRYDVPVGHEKFGKLESCVCRAKDVAESARSRLFAMSNLERLSHLTFENFNRRGNKKAKFMTPQESEELDHALMVSEEFARVRKGWLLLEGGYGCGKTHLAAAIANDSVNHGVPTLFITVPDLLDSLRFAYADPETTFERRFEEVRNSSLLILDDFGTHNATGWAQEKLFQIINYRYINKLPTVITTNLVLDEIEGRIRSRLQDDEFVNHIKISAPDYRRPNEISNPGASILTQPEIKAMTFMNFQTREDEIGKVVPVVNTAQKQDKFGNKFIEKEIAHVEITQHDIKTLSKAFNAAVSFTEKPSGWLAFLGQSFCGKTHLAAAIGNHRIALGGQAMLLDVSNLLDYLRQTFDDNSDVSFHRRLHEIRITPLLILDDLRQSSRSSNWSEDKLYSILNYRYNNYLPTVLTSKMDRDVFMINYPSLCNKFSDPRNQICEIDMPAYRRVMKGGKIAGKKK